MNILFYADYSIELINDDSYLIGINRISSQISRPMIGVL